MLYTIGEILLYLAIALLLGVVLGWLIWGRRGTDHECHNKLAEAEGKLRERDDELAALRKDRDAADKAAKEATAASEASAARLAEVRAEADSAEADLKASRAEAADAKARANEAEAAARAAQDNADRAAAQLAELEDRPSAGDGGDSALLGFAGGAAAGAAAGSHSSDSDSDAIAAVGNADDDADGSDDGSDSSDGSYSDSDSDSDSSDGSNADVDATPSALGFSAAAPVTGVAATTAPDDLKDIVGVGPKLNALLIERGITTFRQIAVMTDAEVDELDDSLPDFQGRVRREEWVRQSGELHHKKYGSHAKR